MDSRATKATQRGAADVTGQSINKVPPLLGRFSGSASTMNTSLASSPLAPCTVSNCTASAGARLAIFAASLLSSRTKPCSVAKRPPRWSMAAAITPCTASTAAARRGAGTVASRRAMASLSKTMRSTSSCGVSARAASRQPRQSCWARGSAAPGTSSASTRLCSHGLRSLRACCDSHSKSSSLHAIKGLFKTRAKARSLPGEANTSSAAMRSSDSGASASSRASGTTCGTPLAASACAIVASTERVRASTMISPARASPLASSCTTAPATWRASCTRSRSSTSILACVSEGRHTLLGKATSRVRSRSTSGRLWTAPTTRLAVVCWRKACQASCAAASSNSGFRAATTAAALRRVWSHASTLPPRPCAAKALAASNTRGSARRNL